MKTNWREVAIAYERKHRDASRERAALWMRLEALADEADAGGDHATAARIRAALWGEDDTDGDDE